MDCVNEKAGVRILLDWVKMLIVREIVQERLLDIPMKAGA